MKQLILKASLFFATVTLFLFAACTKTNEVTNLTLNKSSVSFTLGQTDSLIATITANGDLNKFTVTWTTTDPTVMTVVKGKIVGVSKGTATITAKAGGKTATCNVTVTDEISSVTTKGILVYFGDILGTSISHLFEVGLASPIDTIYLMINAPLTATSSLPVGNYKLLTSLNSLTDLVPYSIIPGELDNDSESFSWYIGNSLQSEIIEGDFNITSLSSSTYTITYNFIDYYGNTISGTYQGSLYYYDETISSTSSSVKKGMLSAQHSKLTFNKLKQTKIK